MLGFTIYLPPNQCEWRGGWLRPLCQFSSIMKGASHCTHNQLEFIALPQARSMALGWYNWKWRSENCGGLLPFFEAEKREDFENESCVL